MSDISKQKELVKSFHEKIAQGKVTVMDCFNSIIDKYLKKEITKEQYLGIMTEMLSSVNNELEIK